MLRLMTILAVAIVLLAPGCSLPPKVTLADINPVRTYHVSKVRLYDAVREFTTIESYKVERFELESGSIRAHKNLSTRSGGTARMSVDETRHVLMTLKVRDVPPDVVEMTASFGYADYQGTFSSEDEGMLVTEYNSLFAFLEDQFKK
jgi:hypothetical protein